VKHHGAWLRPRRIVEFKISVTGKIPTPGILSLQSVGVAGPSSIFQ